MIPWFRKIGWLLSRRRREAELEAELNFHLQEEAEEHAQLSPEAARLEARRDLGSTALVAEDVRAAWGWTRLEQLAQDVRYALRTMRSNRGFTALAVVSLGLGIGANTAIYSFIESILLRSLPVPEPQSLVVMKWQARTFPPLVKRFGFTTGGSYVDPNSGTTASIFPYPALALFEANTRVLSNSFCYVGTSRLDVTIHEQTEAVEGQYVSGGYFGGMGVPPAAGRLLMPRDDQTGAGVAALSYRYAQQRFGDPLSAVGQAILINNVPFTVVGVAPPGFFGMEPAAAPVVWLPLHANLLAEPGSLKTLADQFVNRNTYWVEVVGRLQPAVTRAQAQAILAPQFREWAESTATNANERANLPRLVLFEGAGGLDSLRHTYSRPLMVVGAMAGLILLIACANISNLLLARGVARRREIAVRLSMGASRMRVVRQLLTESLLLASAGGALGVGLALWGIRFLTVLLGSGRSNFTLHAELNWQVLGVTMLLSALTGVLFGLVPALESTRADVMPALKEMRAGIERARQWMPRIGLSRMLVGAQIAVCVVLLVAASLFGETLSKLQSIEVGFNRENILLFQLRPRTAGYSAEAARRLCADIRQRLQEIPGVRAVGLSSAPPLPGQGTLFGATRVAGMAPPTGKTNVGMFETGPGFFEAMQIPVLAGREFDERDGPGGAPVALVNQRFLKVFGLENPLGRTVILGSQSYQIVGVVGDAHFMRLKEAQYPMLYTPFSQPSGQATFEVRAAGNPLAAVSAVREIVRQVDSRLAIAGVESAEARIDREISQEIALARLCSLFAGLALAIACVGLYATVAFQVTRRTNEIGIRMALGAQRKGIVVLVLREVLAVSFVGLAVGATTSLWGSRFVSSFLYGIQPRDPRALAVAVTMLLAAASLAGYVPARRASRIDPMSALRHE